MNIDCLFLKNTIVFFKNTNYLDPKQPPDWINSINSKAVQINEQWQEGFIAYGIKPKQAINYSNYLYVSLLNYIDSYTDNYSEAILALDDFFTSLPETARHFRLFNNFLSILEAIVYVVLGIPTMYKLLRLSPTIVESLMIKEEPEWQTVANVDIDIMTKMQKVRSQLNNKLSFYYLPVATAKGSVSTMQNQLSNLALDAIDECMAIACQQTSITKPPIGLLAFGRLASNRMNPLSDIDLVYIAEYDQDTFKAEKYADDLNRILQLQMQDGLVYQVDNRLRPSGKSGSLCVSIQTWDKYLTAKSFTWEHIALVFAKAIKGSNHLKNSCHKIKRNLFSRKRQVLQCKMDAIKMIQRIRQQRGKNSKVLDIKTRAGGALECDFLIALTVLLYAHSQPNIYDEYGMPNILEIEKLLDCKGLYQIWQTYNVLTGLESLFELSGKTVEQINKFNLKIIFKHLQITDITELQLLIANSTKFIIAHLQKLLDFEELSIKAKDWQEGLIIWE